MKELNGAGVPCSPIYSIDQMFEDAQVQYPGIAQDVQRREPSHPKPVSLSRTSEMVARPLEFGEQTDEVLAEFRFSADAVDALK